MLKMISANAAIVNPHHRLVPVLPYKILIPAVANALLQTFNVHHHTAAMQIGKPIRHSMFALVTVQLPIALVRHHMAVIQGGKPG